MALLDNFNAPILRENTPNIPKLRNRSISISPYSTKIEDSNHDWLPHESRRSSRRIKRPNVFNITHDQRNDPELRAALKRSKLDTVQQQIDYSSIDPVPIVYATNDEFANPIKLWNKYSSLGEEYGAIKVIPPENYTGSLPIDLEKFKFHVRQQRIQFLSTGNGFSHPSQLWTCEKMRQYDRMLKEQIMHCQDPELESVEKEYWSMVRQSDPRVTSYYGADLNAMGMTSNMRYNYLLKVQDTDPWNMYNLPRCEGSLLKHIKTVVPGVNSPWLYIGMIFTSFCWHTEDNYFGSVNYHHSGAPKVWYLVPPRQAQRMEMILKNYSSLHGEEFALYGLRVQIPPDMLIANEVTLYRTVQRENEFIMVWPRTFHCGFNAGFNCNEACNIAPGNWIKMGYQSLVNYKYARKTCIPFFRIILSSIPNLLELEATHISSIIECLSLLIAEEYEARSRTMLPTYQMYFDPDMVQRLPEIRGFMLEVDTRDFDMDLFINALYKSNTLNEYEFLVACKEMAEFCIKDCDLCDSPTFGSAVMCNHSNVVVCLSCLKFHDCRCRTRVVLYRFPLLMFHALLMILKKVYASMAKEEWDPTGEFKTPKAEKLAKVDSEAMFAFRDLVDAEYRAQAGPMAVLDDETLEEEFEEITEACRKMRLSNLTDKRRRKGRMGKLVVQGPDDTSSLAKAILSTTNLIHVSKLTLKYTILALNEDKMESD